MSLNAAAIAVMVDRGLTAADILAVAEALEIKRDRTGAERQARYRKRKAESNGVTVTRDVTGVTVSPIEEIHTPSEPPSVISDEITPPSDLPVSKKEILDAWHDRMVPLGFPAVRKMTAQRERQLKARLRDSKLEDWQRAFDALERSSFLRGENDRGWRADFDFLLQPKSFTKLIEGAYDH